MQAEVIWQWIEKAKQQGLRARSAAEDVAAQVESLEPEQRTTLAADYLTLLHRSDRLQIWEACSLINGCTASDDVFEYFRNWLIWSGPELFSVALNETDSLSDACRSEGIDIRDSSNESLGVLAKYADPRDARVRNAIATARNWSWHDSSAARIAADLPRLWREYGPRFEWEPGPLPPASEFDAPGLGSIRVGDRVRHKFGYGEGVVVEVLVAETSLANIAFSDATRPFRVTSTHFERVA